tara:strand:- start:500 stop:1549 length:1050 start_codon:yes stop_codon:yes gene_type:complete
MNKKSNKKLVILFGFTIVCIIGITYSLILYWPQNTHHSNSKISIKSGTTLAGLTNVLFEENIITNKKIFKLAVKMLGKEKKIPVGTFQIIKAKSNYQIIKQLMESAPEIVKIRILEGWDLKKIAGYLGHKMDFDSTDVINLATDENFLINNGITVGSIEGYLYPDTYFFFEGETEKIILTELLKQNSEFWKQSFKNRAKELGYSEHEILTLASIIEGEAIFDSERPKISAVYHNRLNINMKLQADPTIQYIIDDAPRRILNRDLRIKSSYNTYLHKGLPPGPINSPGRKSILAALYPEENDFLFFVAKGDGYHTFSTNERDHNKAKRRFQLIRKQLKKRKKENESKKVK